MVIRILLVDDRASIREGLHMRLTLEPDLSVIGEAANGLEALVQARALAPDVVVMDVEMPGQDGLAATQALRLIAPRCEVVLLSLRDDPQIRQSARAAGAAAFVTKQSGDVVLLEAIRRLRPPPAKEAEP